MYSTCIFCHSSLGTNEAIEHFPVGKRLAFDSAKGRLWAVCPKCGRWNLTPLEERWEAVEECERQFRGTILRTSTDQIGLARVKEGTDLIRIGEPLRPEFAAWRYGRHFKKRRQVHQALQAGGFVAMIGLWAVSGNLIGISSIATGVVAKCVNRRNELGRARRFIVQQAERGFKRKIWKAESVSVRIIRSDDEHGWALRFAHDAKFLDFHGPDALHTAHIVSPALNFSGGKSNDIDLAVRQIEHSRTPDAYFKRVLQFGESEGWHYTGLDEYPEHLKLGFEMVAHEETERRALEGELAQLEQDWREAEEIASIADNMFVPEAFKTFIERYRGDVKS